MDRNRRLEIALTAIGLVVTACALLFGDNIYLQITGHTFVEEFRRLFGSESTTQPVVIVITATAPSSISRTTANFEQVTQQSSPTAPLPTTLPTQYHTPVLPTSVASLCPGNKWLNAGKGFMVTMQKDCYYHFNVACNGCQKGEENNFVVHYVGDSIGVTVPEGSVWQYSRIPNWDEVCSDTRDHWPTSLPSFLKVPGVEQLFPCR